MVMLLLMRIKIENGCIVPVAFTGIVQANTYSGSGTHPTYRCTPRMHSDPENDAYPLSRQQKIRLRPSW